MMPLLARRTLTACYLFNEDFARIVDLQVIKTRTNVSWETTQTRGDFRDRMLKRDVRCVWTGIEPKFGGVGLHIIPVPKYVHNLLGIFLIVSVPSTTISVASADHSESTKLRRECGDTE